MSAVIFSGDGVKALKNRLKLKDDAHIVSGSVDPQVAGINAPVGSLYLRTTGQVYVKGATWDASTHTHANKALLDTYTQTNADITDVIAKEHEHTNKTILDSYTLAEHTHANKTILDSYTLAEHTHANKTILDSYTQTEADIADAISKEHEHSNKALLDSYTVLNSYLLNANYVAQQITITLPKHLDLLFGNKDVATTWIKDEEKYSFGSAIGTPWGTWAQSPRGTFDTETVNPLVGNNSWRHTQHLTVQNEDEWIKSNLGVIDRKFRGKACTLKFSYTYDGADDDWLVVVKDYTGSTILSQSSDLLKASSTVGEAVVNFVMPAGCEQIEWGFNLETIGAGKVLVFDYAVIELYEAPVVNSHVYSTSEKVVGEWINGETVYERSFELTQDYTVGGIITTIDTGLKIIGGHKYNASGWYIPNPPSYPYDPGNTVFFYYSDTNGRISISIFGKTTYAGTNFTLRYTKS